MGKKDGLYESWQYNGMINKKCNYVDGQINSLPCEQVHLEKNHGQVDWMKNIGKALIKSVEMRIDGKIVHTYTPT